MQVVVLAGGLGTRLGARGVCVPKALQPIRGTPFIDFLILQFFSTGIRRFHFALGHLAPVIVRHVERTWSDRVQATFSVDAPPQGTGSSLRSCVDALDEVFLLVFGDAYLPEDPIAFQRSLRPDDAASMAVSRWPGWPVPNVEVRGDRVAVYSKTKLERPALPGDGFVGSDAGWLMLRRSAVSALAEGPSDLGALHQSLIGRGALGAWVTDKPFYDIGTDERIALFEASPWSVYPSSTRELL